VNRSLVTHGILAVALLAACGKSGPRWAKRADQIDMATWVNLCGEERSSSDVAAGGYIKVPFHEEMFWKPSPAHPQPESPRVDCYFQHRVDRPEMRRLYVSVIGRPDELTPALIGRYLALVADFVPASVRPVLEEVARSPEHMVRTSHGFRIENDPLRDSVSAGWSLSVSVAP
jgi:hypothetical protein